MKYKILLNKGITPKNTDGKVYAKICEAMGEYHRSELLKLNKSDVISSLSESEECKCIRFVGGDKYYPNGCEIHPNG